MNLKEYTRLAGATSVFGAMILDPAGRVGLVQRAYYLYGGLRLKVRFRGEEHLRDVPDYEWDRYEVLEPDPSGVRQ